MKFIAFAFLFSLSAVAAERQYQVSTEVIVGGKTIATPRIGLAANSTAEMKDEAENGNSLRVKVTAVPGKNEALQLNYEVSYSSPKKSVKAKPSVIVKLGQTAMISVGPKGKEELTLKVTATENKDVSKIVDTFSEDELGKAYANMPMSDEEYLETLEMTDPPPAESLPQRQ